jgi:uncharacterized protein YgbK (DUF1537 family)
MPSSRLVLSEVLDRLPPVWPDDLQSAIQAALQTTPAKLVVLDDDPTGTQTVHDIPVLTSWSVPILRHELENDLPACFLLTNSRSFPLPEAQALNAAIGRNLQAAARETGRSFAVVSRSDSTLRGHFPGEVEALVETLGQDIDAWLLIPFFEEGGRYTIGDTHYVAEGDHLVPAGETEFARDAAFGYRASDLHEWVEEKTAGRIAAQDVASVSLDTIRSGGPEAVTAQLMALSHGKVCIVNAASRRDMEVFTLGLLTAEARGKHFLYRTAASFVPIRAGVSPRPLLTCDEMIASNSGGGLVVVGSHVPRTSSQLEHLLQQPEVVPLEVDVSALLADTQRSEFLSYLTRLANAALDRHEDVVLFTSRELMTGVDADQSFAIGQRVSEGLVTIVKSVSARPRYILAKGGITSSDVATQGLGVQRAMVLGQVLPGVPVWQLGPETRHPGLSYIVFPGNVGGPEALAQIVAALRP